MSVIRSSARHTISPNRGPGQSVISDLEIRGQTGKFSYIEPSHSSAALMPAGKHAGRRKAKPLLPEVCIHGWEADMFACPCASWGEYMCV